MKRNLISQLFALSLFVAFLLSSCDRIPTEPESTSPTTSPSELFTITEYDVFAGDFQEATLEHELAMRVENGKQNPPARPIHLMQVLQLMNLTEEQKAEVLEYLQAHRECVKAAMMNMQAQQRQLMEQVNNARKTIMEKLKAGEMTREQAKEQLRQLNENFFNAMHKLRVETCEALKECRKALFDAISDMELTEEQRAIWERWLASLPEIVCDRPVKDNGGRGPGQGPNR